MGRQKGFKWTEEQKENNRKARLRKQRNSKKWRHVPVYKTFNKHNLICIAKSGEKVCVMAWIQPEGQLEVISKVIVNKGEEDDVTVQTLLDAYHQIKVQNPLFFFEKTGCL